MVVFSNKKIINDYNVETTQSQLCKNYKMSKATKSRLVDKYKTKEMLKLSS